MSRLSSSSLPHDNHDDDLEPIREIKCPVHGYIPVSKFITSIIDTAQFQRLRSLKQLGTSYFVWPGASHNRFEHSLGVFHLARLLLERLRTAQPALRLSPRDARCVEVAALCHDLGHGPFSHVWDNCFIPAALPGTRWRHEDASEMMLDALVRENAVELDPADLAFVKDLISGEPRHTAGRDPPEKSFLFEIVANKRNGIDVDKFDYIARDSKAVSSGTTTDLVRLINSARVIDGEICYSEKNTTTVYGLFQERFKLHKTIYQHKTAKSIEYMIVDALLLANPHLKIAERIHDARMFLHLNDGIINEVERSSEPELEEARKIIHRIRTRDLYMLVDKTYLPWDSHKAWKENFTPARIVAVAKSSLAAADGDAAQNVDSDSATHIDVFSATNISAGAAPNSTLTPDVRARIAQLTESHVIVDLVELHHGMGHKFPLDNCKFYGKYEPDKAYPPRREEDISHLLPKEFGEVLVRVFTRDSRFFGVIQTAARTLSETIRQPAHTSPAPSTPRTSFMSISTSEPAASTSASTSMASIGSAGLGTPAHNNYLTVPVDFTPRKTALQSPGSQTPGHNNYMTVPVDFTPRSPTRSTRRTRARAREEDVEPGSDGSPATKRMKKSA